MRRELSYLVLTAFMVANLSCYSFRQTSEIIERETSRRTEVGIVRAPQPQVEVNYVRGNLLALTLYRQAECFDEKWVTFERENLVSRQSNQDELIAMFVLGSASLLAGVIGLLVAPGLSDERLIGDDGTEQSSDQESAYQLGWTGVVFGGGFLLVGVGNWWNLRDRVEQLPSEERMVTRTTGACQVEPVDRQPITTRFGNSRVDLGVSNSNGLLRLRLDDVIPREVIVGDRPQLSMTIVCDREVLGRVGLQPYHQHLEDLAWEAVASTENVEDLESFLEEFPQSRRSPEAQESLTRLRRQARVAALRDDWQQAQSANNNQAYLAFIAAHPSSEQASTARLEIVQRLIRAGRHGEALQRIDEWSRVDATFAARADALGQELQSRQRAEQQRQTTRAVSSVRESIAGCTTNTCGPENAALAREAYSRIDASRNLLGEEQSQDFEVAVIARCGCTRHAVRE